jgi:PAS domain S-box-containing protein
VTSLGPYVAVSLALAGFALFAAVHHLHLWLFRRERTSLLFVACCVPSAVVCAAHAVAASALTVEAGQMALDLRTTFGLLNHTALAWLIASVSGVRATPYRWALTAFLLSGAVVNEFAFSLVGDVDRLERVLLPWGEELTVLTRSAPVSEWYPRALYAAVVTVQVYALFGARALWRRDRTAASLMAGAACTGLVASLVGVLIDTQVVRWPYVGQLAVAVWIILMATLLSREHARRGDMLDASDLQLRVSEARYRTLIESAPEAIVVLDVERGCFVDLNQQACALFGLPASELKLKNPVDLSPPFQPDGRASKKAAPIYLEEAVRGGAPVFEWMHRTPAGRDIPCEIRLVRFTDPSRILVRGSITDISERRQLEEQLRQSQKMEAIGQLAGGIAHDFNNLLTVISGYAELLHQQLEPGDSRLELIEAIEDSGARAAWLTERLLAFSRRAVLTPQVMDFNRVVRDSEGILRRLLGEKVQLTVLLAEDLDRVRIDQNLWSQVILNLAINARDAMPQGGRLNITTGAIDLEPPATSERPPGRYVRLSIADTGCGMPAEVTNRIFEPFFTTKPAGKGTGLGLSVVHGIVTQAGGFIDVTSTPGAGTTFHVHVPIVTDAAGGDRPHESNPSAVTSPMPAPSALRQESILLVEDSDAVRRFIEAALRPQGFRVLVAHDGDEALRILEAHDGRIDLLISDLIMPGVHGNQLRRSVRSRNPALKALYISGQVDDEMASVERLESGEAFLQKPFSVATFTRKVRELLDADA